ncbi:hypothetical protein ACFE04_024889 [Oxalis oulophora]
MYLSVHDWLTGSLETCSEGLVVGISKTIHNDILGLILIVIDLHLALTQLLKSLNVLLTTGEGLLSFDFESLMFDLSKTRELIHGEGSYCGYHAGKHIMKQKALRKGSRPTVRSNNNHGRKFAAILQQQKILQIHQQQQHILNQQRPPQQFVNDVIATLGQQGVIPGLRHEISRACKAVFLNVFHIKLAMKKVTLS